MNASAASSLSCTQSGHDRDGRDHRNELDQTREQLETALARYTDLYETAPVGYATLDREGMVQGANRTLARLVGTLPSQLVGRRLGQLVAPTDRLALADALVRTFAGQEPVSCQVEFCREDGGRCPVELHASLDHEGRSCRMVAIDLSGTRRMEAALRAQDERLHILAERATDLITCQAPDGTIRYASPAALALLGIPAPELVGRPFDELLHPDDRNAVASVRRTSLARQGHFVVGCRMLRRDGGVVWVETAGCAASDPATGRLREIQAATRDISRRRQSRESGVLDGQRRGQRQKLEVLARLAGGIAHDFNNRLAAIMGNAEQMLRRLETGSGLRYYANSIIATTQSSAEPIRQLLDFARKGKFRHVAIDVRQLVGTVRERIARVLGDRIAIAVDLPGEVGQIAGDPAQIEAALLSLALNAREAMPEGGTLTLAAAAADLDDQARSLDLAPGRYVRIAVADTGHGLSPQAQQHLFEPFFTTKPLGQGSGLGLAAVYGAARSHLGAVTVENGEHGCVATLWLPAGIGAGRPEAAGQPAPHLPRGFGRILVIEDEPGILAAATDGLRGLGYTVTACADGDAAVGACCAEAQGFDLAILDMSLPGLGGKDAFAALRMIDPSLRVLLCSGDGCSDDIQALLDRGAVGVIGKPAAFPDLARQVAAALGAED